MPYFERHGAPRLHFELDDFTDPWKPARAILLQHGYARSSKFWRACVPYLSRFYKIIRLDLRGLGKSDRSFDLESGINLDAYLDDFNALLDHLSIKNVHYCGESSAGTLGFAYAALYPQRVRTLSVISSPVYMTEDDKMSALHGHANRVEALRKMGARGWLEASNAGRRFPTDTDPRLLAWSLDEMGASDTEVLVAMFKFVSTVDTTPLLSRITAPVLGLYPAGDVITKDEHLELLREKVRNIRIVRVPSGAHSLQVVQPAMVASTVLHFIAAHDGIACHE